MCKKKNWSDNKFLFRTLWKENLPGKQENTYSLKDLLYTSGNEIYAHFKI